MSRIVDKFLGVIGLEVEDELGESGEHLEEVTGEREMPRHSKKGQLIGLPSQRQSTMILVKARSFDEVESIAQNIKDRRSVIVNVEDVEKEVAQRMIDFLSGAVFALDGSVQKVSAGTFLFATCNVDVVGQIWEEERDRALAKFVSWAKK